MISGRANYVDDMTLPGMLYAAIVRSPEAHATIVSIDKSAAEERSGVVAVLTGEDLADDFASGLPMALGPAGRGHQHARPLAAQARRGQARGRPGRRGRGRRPLPGGGRRRGRDRRVRRQAGRRGSRGGARGGLAARLGAVRDEQDPRVGRRRAGTSTPRWPRPRRGRGAARRQPPHLGRPDRAARRRSREPRGENLTLYSSTQIPHIARCCCRHAGHARGQAARGGSRRGRRLRLQAAGVCRGGARAGARQAPGGPAGQVDRVALGEHDHDATTAGIRSRT